MKKTDSTVDFVTNVITPSMKKGKAPKKFLRLDAHTISALKTYFHGLSDWVRIDERQRTIKRIVTYRKKSARQFNSVTVNGRTKSTQAQDRAYKFGYLDALDDLKDEIAKEFQNPKPPCI